MLPSQVTPQPDIQERPGPGAILPDSDWSGQDFSGQNLVGITLRNANLCGTNFFRCDLRNADLSGADLSDAELSGANLTGANLELIKGHSTGFGAAILHKASFFQAKLRGATFSQADLREANFHGADLSQSRMRECLAENCIFADANLRNSDLSMARVGKSSFYNADLRSSRLRMMRNFKKSNWIGVDIRDINFAGAHLLRRHIIDQNYIKEFRSHNRLCSILYYFWWLTCDCGRSMLRWCAWITIQTILFAWLYTLVDLNYGSHPTFLSPLYFSVVTLTTLGYGDVIPASLSAQIVAMIEVMIGYMMLGGLLSIFSNKIARRGE